MLTLESCLNLLAFTGEMKPAEKMVLLTARNYEQGLSAEKDEK